MRKKQYGILGLSRFGMALATSLAELGADVIAVDKNSDRVQKIANDVAFAVQADISDINALKSIGLKNVDVVVVAVGSDINSSIMGVINAQELGIKKVYGKAGNLQHERVLLKLGVTKVFFPEADMGERVAHNLYTGDFIDMLELDSENSIIEVDAPAEWDNQTLERLNLRTTFGLNVIAIRTLDKLNISPLATDKIHRGDKLVVIGDTGSINEIQRLSREGR